MKKIGYFKRIGIEAEIHRYSIEGPIGNKITLATSTNYVADGINYPLLQLLSEGEGQNRYLELVFGPVRDLAIPAVIEAVKISLDVNLGSGKLTIGDWVNGFNLACRKFKTYHLNVISLYAKTKLKLTTHKAASIQANILFPIKSFSDETKINVLFRGMNVKVFPFEAVYTRLEKAANSYGIYNKTLKGAVFLAVYICYIYTEAGREFGSECTKQNFPILPKVELLTVFREIGTLQKDESKARFEEYLKAIVGLSDLTCRSPLFIKNANLLIQNLTDPAAKPLIITPRLSGVLPIYISEQSDPCIVIEVRKGAFGVLDEIASGRVPSGIW